MKNLIHLCVQFLGITKPYSIKLVSRKRKDATAVYVTWFNRKYSKIVNHDIKVYLGNEDLRDVETLIAHEFIHAWQAEYAPNSKSHGRKFQQKAQELYDFLESHYYYLPDMYLPDTDD